MALNCEVCHCKLGLQGEILNTPNQLTRARFVMVGALALYCPITNNLTSKGSKRPCQDRIGRFGGGRATGLNRWESFWKFPVQYSTACFVVGSTIPIVSPRIFTFQSGFLAVLPAGEAPLTCWECLWIFPVPNPIFQLVSLLAARVFSFDLNRKAWAPNEFQHRQLQYFTIVLLSNRCTIPLVNYRFPSSIWQSIDLLLSEHY